MNLKSIIPFSLRRNISYMLIGNLVYALSQWGIIMALAKLGSARMVGEFSLGLAITAPVILIFDLQLRSVIATDTKNEFSFRQYLILRGISSFLVLGVLAGIVIFQDYHGQLALVIYLIGVAKLLESIFELYYGLFQRHEKMDWIAKSLIFRGIASVALISILIFLTKNLLIAILCYCFSWLCLFIFIDRPKARHYKSEYTPFEWHPIKRLFLTSLPLGIVMMMISLYTNIPRYFLENLNGINAVGYYSALFYIVIAGNLVINAVGQSISPRLAIYFTNNEYTKFSKLLNTFILLGGLYGMVATILTILIGKQVLEIIYTQEYTQYHQIFILLMVSGMIMYSGSFLGYALTAMRKFAIQPYLASIWVGATVFLSYLLIPKYGLLGAAYVAILVTAIQFITQAATVYWLLYRTKKQTLLQCD
ncbi:lipopolysaccharide biosynthesis protein [Pseudoneobacillus sp. C159]